LLSSTFNFANTQPMVFVDLETTGGTFGVNRITEIGVVEVTADGIEQWSSLVNPQQPIPSFIQQLTGIDEAMVRHAPTFEEIAHDLLSRLNGRLFVAHNARFDHGFLRGEFKRMGIKFQPDVLCTVQLSRAVYPTERRHGLDALIERHALVPFARHRALADADLLWQFWQHLHASLPADVLRIHIESNTRRFHLAGDIDEETIEQMPAGCGIYTFFGDDDLPLYVGRSARVRQRVRAHLSGVKRSAKDLRLAAMVRRVTWSATGGEVGAMLAEGRAIAALQPPHNRLVKARGDVSGAAPWIYPGAVAIEEIDTVNGTRVWHVVDRWQYLGTATSLNDATLLSAADVPRQFEPSPSRS
jgi:DNA polymerase-3 subunit epsilon